MRTMERGHGSAPSEYHELRSRLHRTIVESIDLSRLERWKPERVRSEVQSLARDEARRSSVRLSDIELDQMTGQVLDEVFGLGPLEPIFKDPEVTEILVNAPDKVYVEKHGRLQAVDAHFTDNAHLTRVIQRIASRVGRRVDESSPMVDARLADGSRVNAVLPPLSADGPALSIRRFGHVLKHDHLLKHQSITPEMLGFLRSAIIAKTNILISGGGGAGKTTMLNILSGFIPANERLVTIEDTLELGLPHDHVVRMETRSANLEGLGAITQRDLLRNSLRMRPDRIIVGEVRGAEVVDMLQAMNTGHEGSLTTIHANSPRDALARLEMMVRIAGFEVPVEVMRNYIGSAIGLIVQVHRYRGGERKVSHISELCGIGKKGRYVVRDLFHFQPRGMENDRVQGVYRATGTVPRLLNKLNMAGVPLPADLFQARDLSHGGRS
ncbi:MAG: CpaF family protein [Gemmataceae bacterium]